ncbi:HNH endonuclease [Defluviimonas sp. D31]|uniref:HNH endonuclease n=1 Tax=Defluviimonas sp. D31 TaxID=3083253 RepID=UPI00296E926E|nr:HNH endonuclease [Defluviimonas sp. D31]MDW4548834.1 HNH endonuclease [Defluviimonas sp. D31]
MSWGFEKGRTYNRRADIHARFKGQQQGGIITPAEHNLVIIVTGEKGEAHGYSDRRRSDGVFEYFGEGQRGDMQMRAGNKAIREHAENGKDLLLFAQTKEGYRFDGQFVYEGHHIERAPDTEGNMRDAIVFELRPLESVIETVEAEAIPTIEGSLAALRERALAASRAEPARGERAANVFERSRVIRSYVFARAKGKCEDCGHGAPFVTAKGEPFLEAHHIRRLTDGGPDDPRFMIALCPNCHRRAHFGRDAEVRNQEMLAYVHLIEGNDRP